MIHEVKGDIVDHWRNGFTIGITTNGFVKGSGRAVMGAGIAKTVRDTIRNIDLDLGEHISRYGNIPAYFPQHRIFTFPVKHNWWENADIDLIRESAEYLNSRSFIEFHFVRPGCGNGKLNWDDVKPILEGIFVEKDAYVWDFE